MIYPELNEKSYITIQIKLKGQSNWRKGMFYLNGGKPMFCSFGSNVTEKIEEWKYIK